MFSSFQCTGLVYLFSNSTLSISYFWCYLFLNFNVHLLVNSRVYGNKTNFIYWSYILKSCWNSLLVLVIFLVNSKQDTTTHLLEWLKLRRLTITTIGKDVGEMEFSYTTAKHVKCYNYFEKHLGNFLKGKHTSTIWSSHSIPMYLSRRN